MATVFTKIIEGEIPSYKILEDENFIAFLDINPNAKGHTLCVPKEEVDKLFDLGEHMYLQLMQFSRRVAKALEKAVECKRIGMSVVGLEVPHVHVHLIPINEMKDMTFQHKITMTEEEFTDLAATIKQYLQG
ncbi:HIT family protein [Altibacter sp. HG106]|uniref:HIT family protein n=1 Tax=Altibacter sp. HG106 TaxID=3023937 RepID=UPI002350314D|nr:HIT family protein [Altibacter sp. HG106]MDC7995231.1 HIT family protein [Altibacter sp. HG106]